MATITIDNVTKRFGKTLAVDAVSTRIEPGRIYGLLGPNGAGKTTTIRMLMNIIRPDAGRIAILDQDPARVSRARVGYLPEERGLYRKMTARRILAYFGALKGLSGSALDRRVAELLRLVELVDKADTRVEQYSRGMQQKLQFAVTIVNDPEVLILDEPFSGLDPVNVDLLTAQIARMRDDGRTIILSTHAMHEAERLCEHILMISRGRIVIDGSTDSIRASRDERTVRAELFGDDAFLTELEYVTAARRVNGAWELDLDTPDNAQRLLRDLAGRVRVRAFEVKRPTLHEIFVARVKEDHA